MIPADTLTVPILRVNLAEVVLLLRGVKSCTTSQIRLAAAPADKVSKA
jgi:hypothetical protein